MIVDNVGHILSISCWTWTTTVDIICHLGKFVCHSISYIGTEEQMIYCYISKLKLLIINIYLVKAGDQFWTDWDKSILIWGAFFLHAFTITYMTFQEWNRSLLKTVIQLVKHASFSLSVTYFSINGFNLLKSSKARWEFNGQDRLNQMV